MKVNNDIHFSEFKLVLSLIVKNHSKFNIDFKLLVKHIIEQNILNNDIADSNRLCQKLEDIKNKLFKTIDDEFYKILFIEDVGILKKIISKKTHHFDLNNLLNIGESTLKILNKEFNTHITKFPNIFVTNNFPVPFDKNTTWDFMYASKEDERKYNLKEGLYIHKDRQFPIYCEYLIIHELVHYYIDKIKRTKVTRYRWIEESIANWYALIIHYKLYKNKEFVIYIKNINELYNHIFPYSVIAEYSYYDRALQKIYNMGGHQGIIKFCNEYILLPNDKRWQQLFDSILKRDFEPLEKYALKSVPKNELDLLLFDSSIDTQILNLTSLEYIIFKNLEEKGILINKLTKKTDIKFEFIEKGINQLQNRGYIIMQNEKIEIIDNAMHLYKSELLKVNYLWK